MRLDPDVPQSYLRREDVLVVQVTSLATYAHSTTPRSPAIARRRRCSASPTRGRHRQRRRTRPRLRLDNLRPSVLNAMRQPRGFVVRESARALEAHLGQVGGRPRRVSCPTTGRVTAGVRVPAPRAALGRSRPLGEHADGTARVVASLSAKHFGRDGNGAVDWVRDDVEDGVRPIRRKTPRERTPPPRWVTRSRRGDEQDEVCGNARAHAGRRRRGRRKARSGRGIRGRRRWS